jgi:hypothetical protein
MTNPPFSFSAAPWGRSYNVTTGAGPRTLTKLAMTEEIAGHWWKLWRERKEDIKAHRFSTGKDRSGAWEICHWQTEPGQFENDVTALDNLANGNAVPVIEEIIEEPEYPPLTTPQAEKLFEWQRLSCQRLVAALKNGNGIDASQTGAGKTFVAIAACAELGLTPYVLAPLAVLEGWRRAAYRMDFRLGGVINYDRARAGSCEFIRKLPPAKDDKGKEVKDSLLFEFSPPQRRRDLFENAAAKSILIFDECQKTKNRDTLQGRILIDTAAAGTKTLLLSATAAKDPMEMYGLGLALGLHQGDKSFYRWAAAHGCRTSSYGLRFTDKPEEQAAAMKKIHKALFPWKGTRVRSADVPGYPENHVSAHLVENADIAKAYAKMESELELIAEKVDAGKMDKKDKAGADLAALMRARRASERGKLDFLIEETADLVADGFFVAVFLNFREHLAIMRDALKMKNDPVWGTKWIGRKTVIGEDGFPREIDINGPAQKPHERQRILDEFNGREGTRPQSRIILVSLSAGGAGINLHDEFGYGLRQSLISPSYSVIDLIQSVGRIWRAGGTKATQRIIFAARTVEEEIAVNLESKCSNLEHLNDGDLMGDSMAKVIAAADSADLQGMKDAI